GRGVAISNPEGVSHINKYSLTKEFIKNIKELANNYDLKILKDSLNQLFPNDTLNRFLPEEIIYMISDRIPIKEKSNLLKHTEYDKDPNSATHKIIRHVDRITDRRNNSLQPYTIM